MTRHTPSRWLIGLGVVLACGVVIDAQISFPRIVSSRFVTGIPDPSDAVNPTVAITTPATDPFDCGTTSPCTVSGTASDNIGVAKVEWSNSLGQSNVVCTGMTSWSCAVNLIESTSNVITITAFDAAGNTATDTVTLEYAPPADSTTVVFRTTFDTENAAGWNQEYVGSSSGAWSGVQDETSDNNLTPGTVSQSGGGGGCTTGGHSSILLDANYASGGGGYGYRERNCGTQAPASTDGKNKNSNALLVITWYDGADAHYGTGVNWAIRYYLRYETGFEWAQGTPPHYDKDWHPSIFNTCCAALGNTGVIPGWQDGRINLFDGGNNYGNGLEDYWLTAWTSYGTPDGGCDPAANDDCASDGTWHAIEHVLNSDAGNGWMFIDGVMVQAATGMNTAGEEAFGFNTSNQNTVFTSTAYKDYDDIVVATVPVGTPPAGGWIGVYNAGRGY